MATLFKNSNSPIWRARYFNADGKRISKTTGTTKKRDAARIAAGYESEERDTRNKASQLPKAFGVILESVTREAAAGSLTLARAEEFLQRLHKLANPNFQKISLLDFWNEWIIEQDKTVTHITGNHNRQYRDMFSEPLGKKIMDAPVGKLTTEQIDGAIDSLVAKGNRKGTTIKKALSCFRRVLEHAVVKEKASHNPAKKCKTIATKDSIKRAPFSIEEVRTMLEHPGTSEEWCGAITVAAFTGLRMSDVTGLSRANIDGNSIVIMPSKTAITEDVLTIPLTRECIAWIGKREGDFFPTLKSQRPAKNSTQFLEIMDESGVPKTVILKGGKTASRSFHSLRHAFASWLAEADIHPDVRQKLTGHKSAGIHAGYIHHDKALDRAVASLPAL